MNNILEKSFPTTMVGWLTALGRTPQGTDWHPEGDCLVHTRIVVNRAKGHSTLLLLSALFHDLGKAVTTIENNKGGWSAHGHEKISAEIVEQHKDWIENIWGIKMEDVKWIVENHMRVKYIDEMTPKKQLKLTSHPLFPDLADFTKFDDMKTVSVFEVYKAKGDVIDFIINKISNFWKI